MSALCTFWRYTIPCRADSVQFEAYELSIYAGSATGPAVYEVVLNYFLYSSMCDSIGHMLEATAQWQLQPTSAEARDQWDTVGH